MRPQNRNGFTIVELLVAATITVLIVVMLGTMFSSLSSTSLRANQRIDAFREARAAIRLMERDITGFLRSSSSPGAYFAAADIYDDPNNNKNDDPNKAVKENRQIFVLCVLKNQPAGNPPPIPGDACAVGYYCRWDSNRYVLRRYFRDSASTFNVFKTTGAGNYVGANALYTPSATDETVAGNIWDLQIVPYDASGNVIKGSGVDPKYPFVSDPSATTKLDLPAAIEVSFKAMSSAAARTVISATSDPKDWMDSTRVNYQRMIAPHVYQFRTRITFPL